MDSQGKLGRKVGPAERIMPRPGWLRGELSEAGLWLSILAHSFGLGRSSVSAKGPFSSFAPKSKQGRKPHELRAAPHGDFLLPDLQSAVQLSIAPAEEEECTTSFCSRDFPHLRMTSSASRKAASRSDAHFGIRQAASLLRAVANVTRLE